MSTAGGGSYLEQTLTTAANSLYTLNFWVAVNPSHPGEFSVFWNGARVAGVLGTANMVGYSFVNLLATGASTAFEIHGHQDDFGIFFGGVPVVGANNVPEPSSLVLIGLGFAGLAFSKRKKV